MKLAKVEQAFYISSPHLASLIPHLPDDRLFLIISEQSRDHPRGQHVVDQLKEPLLSDVGISEKENSLLVFDSKLVV